LQDALNDTDRRAQIATEIKRAGAEAPSSNELEATADLRYSPAGSSEELDAIAEAGRLGYSLEERARGKAWLGLFFEQIFSGKMPPSRDTEGMLRARIAVLDKLVSMQLNEIVHHEKFQKLEASWRGLRYLVYHTNTSHRIKIKVLNTSKRDLMRDIQRAPEFDSSALFRKIYDEEFGMLGGQPFAVFIGDYEFGREAEDVEMLEKISNIAAAASAPFISAAGPSMFSMESFHELDRPRDLSKIFDNEYYVRWKSFRQSTDSQYVGLVLPRILLRSPYGRDSQPIELFEYEENVDGRDSNRYLWGNAAYAFAGAVTKAFDRFGWCAAIRGVEGGGLVDGLPGHTFTTDDGDVELKCSTEIPLTDRRQHELSKLGFIPLVHYKSANYAVFFGAPSCQKQALYLDDEANQNARFSTQLEYVLTLSRFAHYLKVIMRDKVGSFRSRLECEQFLNNWIAGYVRPQDAEGDDSDPKFPLRTAEIKVSEVPDSIGLYRATLFLRPCFQLEEPTVSLRLVARLPEPRG
jgi:type VI secretion system protein ImpC